MNIDERIERRLGFETGSGVITDLDAISPVVHVDSPSGRGPHLEELLDALDPAFVGSLPPSIYVHGPKGSGKTAIVGTLFDRLSAYGGRRRRAIRTSTRVVDPALPSFVHVDARAAPTRFGIYHDTLAAVSETPVPDHGVSTEELADSLREWMQNGSDVVVAVDHTSEPNTPSPGTVVDWLAAINERIVPVCIGREAPESVAWDAEFSIEFDPYRRHALVELLTVRASGGLIREALTHDQVREVAEWADGDAHDGLAAITGAAILTDRAGHSTVQAADLDAGIDAVPKPCVSVGRVLSLSASRQRLLYELVRLSEADRRSVSTATETIAAVDAVDLSASTVRRALYELADIGLLARVPVEESRGKGRPPSRLVPRFPPLVFRELFERERER